MQDLLNSESNNEIDLHELFIILWAYKLFIAGTCALAIIYGGYYSLNTVKKFSSTAIFKLDQRYSGDNSISGELGRLAKITGYNTGNNALTLSVDQFTSRVFIQSLDAELNFQADPHFNTYNPNIVDPIWKSLIKGAIGWKKTLHQCPRSYLAKHCCGVF